MEFSVSLRVTASSSRICCVQLHDLKRIQQPQDLINRTVYDSMWGRQHTTTGNQQAEPQVTDSAIEQSGE